MLMDARKKAELIEAGGVEVDDSFMPYLSRSTAGPGAGLSSFFFSSGGRRVRLSVRESSPYKAVMDRGEVTIFKDGDVFVKGVLEEAISHCPGQVYVTVSEKCVFDCKYCPVPKLQGKIKSKDDVVKMALEGSRHPSFEAISLTSGVWKTPEEEVERVAEIVRELKQLNVPIGVSVYPTDDSSEILKEAGADEIKYNAETIDPDVFEKVCPGLSLDYIVKSLEHAVKIFGRNHVFTNIIIGLGETDETVIKGMDMLASKGIIPILRKVNPHPLRAGEVYTENVPAERLLKLAAEERKILDRYGLRADLALTGCLLCTGCDLVPHRDL
ncbi:radical SAM protein [Methanocella sp. CWC-04]|uniref:Radical SAM protein n=1 Tax=Methanooceanicella nereidis TaxID=2052831 RepID=A0AAP2W5N0_9EURY|nr:radical SAM protein [Methanocella sp. CWC-04]MCD1295695.1 radical SAM protein [Methanocella sp. CWC-04]